MHDKRTEMQQRVDQALEIYLHAKDLSFDIIPLEGGGKFTLTVSRGTSGKYKRIIEELPLSHDFRRSVSILANMLSVMRRVAEKIVVRDGIAADQRDVMSEEMIRRIVHRFEYSRSVRTSKLTGYTPV